MVRTLLQTDDASLERVAVPVAGVAIVVRAAYGAYLAWSEHGGDGRRPRESAATTLLRIRVVVCMPLCHIAARAILSIAVPRLGGLLLDSCDANAGEGSRCREQHEQHDRTLEIVRTPNTNRMREA